MRRILLTAALLAAAPLSAAPRESHDLADWEFRPAGGEKWKAVRVPQAWEVHEGEKFDGVGDYRIALGKLVVPDGRRLLVHFDAVATHAVVSLDGKELGSHLGGWTPFRFDLTDALKAAPADAEHTLTVRVDERVGHNTQGFLPVFLPHFGGIWRPVRLLTVPATHVDDLTASAIGDPDTGRLELRLSAANLDGLEVHVGGAVAKHDAPKKDGDGWRVSVPVADVKRWSPASPTLYDVEVRLAGGDVWRTKAGFRKIEAKGDRLLLNGRPLGVRGVLNWGYHPPLLHPTADENVMRDELRAAKAMGFNLMKCCLWVPPRRYLEIADEMGMLVWMEYPTWHPKLDEKHRPDLEREFREFFARDRERPCVVLRSLTCETGPSADVKVIRRLYDLCKEMVPGAVVEDDSSWIGWNRVHDFWDDHPYGNNHTWVAELTRLKKHVADHGVKPLLLGEAIAADTWTDREPLKDRAGDISRPFWLPRFYDANAEWEERLQQHTDAGSVSSLRQDSERYALLMRKYQIETFRREVPNGGYVVSVLRDFPFAAMGLLDYQGKLKWDDPEYWAWHGDTTLILKTKNDRRTFRGGEALEAELLVSHFGEKPLTGKGGYKFDEIPGSPDTPKPGSLNLGERVEPGSLVTLKFPAVKLTEEDFDDRPHRFRLRAHAGDVAKPEAFNEWDLWVVPKRVSAELPPLKRHPSLADHIAALLPKPAGDAKDAVVVASRFDATLLDHLEGGGRVLMLPDGGKNSFPLAAHWFLRGGPFIADHPIQTGPSLMMLAEMQHFDLAGDVIPNVGPYLEQFDPIMLLWDNHDIKEVRTHGLAFEASFGKGRLLVSALRHHGETNAAGEWLFDRFATHLATGPAPKHGFDDATRKRMRLHLTDERVDLTPRAWQFRPDPKDEGLKAGWHTPDFKPEGWKEIKVGTSWDGQGYADLDGWAWYRTTVDIPKGWAGRDVYLHTEGVDDAYEVYANGKLVGSGGDIPKKLTAFEERKSHRITEGVTPGKPCVIAVRVFDWYGAGGIHRPVSLGTAPRFDGPDLLR